MHHGAWPLKTPASKPFGVAGRWIYAALNSQSHMTVHWTVALLTPSCVRD